MRVLFLGAHCDDIELGCGGLINQRYKHWDISCLTFSQSVVSACTPLREHSVDALTSLGLNQSQLMYRKLSPSTFPRHIDYIWFELQCLKPELVFTQEPDDHKDHTTLFDATMRAFQLGTSIVTYRATSRSCPSFAANLYAPLTDAELTRKVQAIEKYREVYSHKPYLRPEAVKAQAVVDGLVIGCDAAEAFRIVRASTNIF